MLYFLKAVRNIIFLLLTLIGNIPAVILNVWKALVTLTVICFRKDLVPMKAHDYLCIAAVDSDIQEPNSKTINGNIGVICELKGKINSCEFFEKFVKKVVNVDVLSPKHPHIRFRQNIERFGGYWFLKTLLGNLEHDNHITCLTLPKDSVTSSEEAICDWLKVRYGKTNPLWGILLIYRESSQDTIFAFKIHHLLADGYSLLHILDLLTDTEYKYQVQNSHPTLLDKVKMFTEIAFNAFWYNLKLITVPHSPFATRDDTEIFLTLQSISVSTIKEIRKKAHVRFQSVILHIIQNYLKNLMLLTNVGSKDSGKVIIIHSLPWPNHPRETLCNHSSGSAFCFDLKKNKSAIENLAAINKTFEGFHEENLDKAYHYFALPLAGLPISWINLKMFQNEKNKISSFYTQLIGSEEYKNVLDWKCSSVFRFVTPPKQKGIYFTCLTTSNEVRMTIMGPKTLFESQEMANEFSSNILQSAVLGMISSVNESVIYR